MVFHLHLLYQNFKLESWHTTKSLAASRNLGLLTAAGATAATIYYLYVHLSTREAINPIENNHLISAVWSFMTVKWGLGLGFFGQKYKLVLQREYSLLI